MTTTLRDKINAKLPELKKLLFADEPAPEPEKKVEAAKATLVDGTEIEVTPAVEVGATVTVTGPDGNQLPAPDGDHELQDGTVIKVAGGVITEVMPVAEAKKEQPAPASPVDMAQLMAAVDQRIEAAVAKVSEKFKADDATTRKVIGEILTVVQEMAEVPAEPAIKEKRDPFSSEKPATDWVSKLAKAQSTINN